MHWPKGERGPDLGKNKSCEACDHCLSWSVIIDHIVLSRFNQLAGYSHDWLFSIFSPPLFVCLIFFSFFFNMCCKVFQQFEAARRDHLDWKNINTKEKRERKSDFLASSVKHHDEAEFLHHFSFSRLGDFFCFFRVVYSKKRKGKPSSATLSRTTRGSSDSSSLWPP